MIKKIYIGKKADEIADRLQKGFEEKGLNAETAMYQEGYQFATKLTILANGDIESIMADSVFIQNEKDELYLAMPICNLTEVCKKYNLAN